MFVADGMGGMAAGEVASRLAITTALKLVNHSPKWGFKINKKEARELFERVRDHVQAIDETITKRSEADHRLFGMGTTLTVAYSVGVDLFIIHLGDSRAYLFRKGRLQLLTKDHTVAQAMADAGYIAPEEVRHHRKRHVLTNFLGGHHGKVKGDVRWLRLADGDRLLLCSDGLTDMVDDAAITRNPAAARKAQGSRPDPARRGPPPRRNRQRDDHRGRISDSQAKVVVRSVTTLRRALLIEDQKPATALGSPVGRWNN